MGCCAGNNNIRSQQITKNQRSSEKQVVVQRVRRSTATTNNQQRQITISRQHIVPRQKCHTCGFPTMIVNIAGRERSQCSNPNCRIIVK